MRSIDRMLPFSDILKEACYGNGLPWAPIVRELDGGLKPRAATVAN